MNSLDTNLLLVALDESASGHHRAYGLYRQMFEQRGAWVVADQTLFELYRGLRNPKVVRNPLPTEDALEVLSDIRDRSHAMHVAYDISLWKKVVGLLRDRPERKGLLVFDACLAVTLHARGVRRFYPRNVRDFEPLGLFEVVDPLAFPP